MTTLLDFVTALLPVLYGLAAANYAVFFARSERFAERTCTPLLAGTVALHAAFLLLKAAHVGRWPIANLAEVLTWVALAIAAVYLYVERVQRSRSTGVFLVTMAAVVQLAASALFQHVSEPAETIARTSLFNLHTASVVIGYSAFFVSAVYALMFVLLYRALKRKRFGLIFERLPSLDVLASMGMGASLLGLAALTLVIGLGAVMSSRIVPAFWLDPKFISTVVVWCLYASAAFGYFVLGWRGARSVVMSLLGFAVAVLAMLGTSFLWSTFHVFSA